MRFQMRGINHQHVIRFTAGVQAHKYLVEYSKTVPANEAIVDRLMPTIGHRRVAPAQTITDDKHDPTKHMPVINSGNTIR